MKLEFKVKNSLIRTYIVCKVFISNFKKMK